MKINYTKLFLKMHFFFNVGSTGPIIPFLYVYGKQIGISSLIIGSIAAILPILYLIAKPIFGFIMDSFQVWRKVIYLSIFVIANSCFIMIFFLPPLPDPMPDPSEYHFQNMSCITLPHCDMKYHTLAIRSCNGTKETTCYWVCKNTNFSTRLSFYGNKKEAVISPNTTCLLSTNDTSWCKKNVTNYNCNITCNNFSNDQYLYSSIIFWSFVLLMCFGNISHYITISLSDTICFAILGEGNQLKYGKQRLWGTIGFGVTACLTGYIINLWSQGEVYVTYIPSIFLVIIFMCIDVVCCIKMKLPFQSESKTILKDVLTLLKMKSIVIFLCFVTFFGILNSIIHNFLFWYLEDLAIDSGYMGNIKLIEGLIVAMQTIGGEMIFFFLSEKILKKLGYDYTITLCFICFALRLALLSIAPTPWWVLPIEFLQGPSFALCFTAVVAYANEVSPLGASGTVQGLVQGIYNGFGISGGSVIGGFLYNKFGGIMTLRIFSTFAVFSALMYFMLHSFYLKYESIESRSHIKWMKTDDAHEHCVIADN